MKEKIMIRIALLTAFAFFAICGYAQNIKFNGVPLGIGIEQFEPLLIQKGYKVVDKSGTDQVATRNMTYYSGVFAGAKVSLSVMITPISQLAQLVSASFDDYATDVPEMTELQINRKFEEIKTSLSEKYPNAKKTTWNEGYITKAYSLESTKWQINLSVQEHDGIKGLHILYVDKEATAAAKHEYEMDY